MAVIEGVVASVRSDADLTVLTVFPICHSPIRRIMPESPVELVLPREAWQTYEGHRDHAIHMVGRGGVIEYGCADNVIALIRSH